MTPAEIRDESYCDPSAPEVCCDTCRHFRAFHRVYGRLQGVCVVQPPNKIVHCLGWCKLHEAKEQS